MSTALPFLSDRLCDRACGYCSDMDVLSDAVSAMRTGRPHSSRRDKYAPWGMRFEASPGSLRLLEETVLL